jgi:hypothetical protein
MKRHTCPENGHQYIEVPYATVLHHVNKPWLLDIKEQHYYFCDDPGCDVVYFGRDNTLITKSMLRTAVGSKETSNEALICYCFGVNRQQAQVDPGAKAFVIEQTRRGTCSCEVSNPSGRCCLKDFPS